MIKITETRVSGRVFTSLLSLQKIWSVGETQLTGLLLTNDVLDMPTGGKLELEYYEGDADARPAAIAA